MQNMTKIKVLMIAAICLVAIVVFTNSTVKALPKQYTERPYRVVASTDPPCMQMYFFIEQYADSFNIPKRFAYGVALVETGYQGPFHWNYNHAQGSSAGALGPMQIMLPTARSNNNDNVSRERLRNDIEYNVRTSMKVLRKLYNKYGDWKTVFGCYNTGRPCVNGYAVRVYNHQINWNIPKNI
jgi:soluble lytic murein transglycosylase-like protein